MNALLLIQILIPLSSEPADRAALIEHAFNASQSTWRKVETNSHRLTSRELFLHALALFEANRDLDRLPEIFRLATEMQDRDPESQSFGNFSWYWKEGRIKDTNAVEFCMQSGSLILLRHLEKLDGETRKFFQKLIEYSIEGCLNHRPPSSYTNIALMNAQNLILLGEGMNKPKVAEEGYQRLEDVCRYTWEFGIHEYCSPTYYGVNLDCLNLIEAFCRKERGREQARAMLKLLWTDIASNWFEPAQILAGAQSRTYSYLAGRGFLDKQLARNGLMKGMHGGSAVLYDALSRWRPSPEVLKLKDQYPREIRQSWGFSTTHSRTHYMLKDVTLSSSAANYGQMDMPLTVDFAGAKVRTYFIPDGRRDPYGRKKIAAGAHDKALHLRPFWTATQNKEDALGLVLYRPGDIPAATTTLESHIVFPRDVDEIRIGQQRIDLPRPGVVELAGPLFIRKGTAALGIRIPWSSDLTGKQAVLALVDDDNQFGALRLTVAHHSFWGIEKRTATAGAAFWLRIGSGLDTDEKFDTWQKRFIDAGMNAKTAGKGIRLKAESKNGSLIIETTHPFYGVKRIEPAPSRAVLQIDGKEVGRGFLSGFGFESTEQAGKSAEAVELSAEKGVYWEAEAGRIQSPMLKTTEENEGAITCVWMPGRVGAPGGNISGSVTWKLNIPADGTYFLWGRIQTPTPSDDSFWVRAYSDLSDIIPTADWHTGTHEEWEWAPIILAKESAHTGFAFPKGECFLQLRVREDGAKIDKLFASPKKSELPL